MKKLVLVIFLMLAFLIFVKEVKIVFLEILDIYGWFFLYDYVIGE